MRYLLCILLTLPLCANAQFSNGFAPVGAVWYSTWVSQIGAGYMEMRILADSVVGNTTYKKISGRLVQTANGSSVNAGIGYMIVRNDSVWLGNTQPYNLLYDFAANIGDEIGAPTSTINRPFAKVDSIKTINFLGQNKRATYYSKYCSTVLRGRYVVVEGFGIVNQILNYSRRGYNCDEVDEVSEDFVCYNDPTRSYPENCLVSTEEKTQNKPQITVFPNPTSDILKINSTESIKNIKISDLLGRISVEKAENSTETTISVQNLPKGVYFLHINDIFVQKFVKN